MSTANSDLTLSSVVVTNKTSVATAGSATATTVQIPQGGTAANYVSQNNTYVDATTTSTAARYWFAVYPNTANAVDAGTYTLSVKLKDSTGFITTKTLSVKFVTNLASTDATLTVSQVGTLVKGQALTYTSANNIKVVLADANGGKVQTGAALNANLVNNAPTLSAAITTSAGVVSETLDTIADSGVAATDHVASSTSAVATNQLQTETANGTYGVTDSSIAANASTTSLLRIRISNSGVEKTAALTVYAATTAVDAFTDLTLTATGVLAADQLIKSNVDTTTAYTIPTSTKSVKLRINIDGTDGANLPDAAITTSVVWSGNYSSAAVSPAQTSTTSTVSTTDASGNVDLTIANDAPVAGGVATITIRGYGYTAGSSRGTSAGSTVVTLTWATAVATTITVIDPVPSVKVKTGTTNVLTVSVKDQFGNLMSGESLQPTLSSDSSNYASTTKYAAITTGAAGTATFSLTDATAAAGSDVVSFASVSNSSATPGSFTLTYVTTLPVVSTLTGYYSNDATGTASTLVPSTGVYADSGAKLIIKNDRDLTKTLVAVGSATTDDMVAVRFKALTSAGASATGAPVVITAPTGGWVLNSSGLPAASRTVAVGSDGYVSFQILATASGSLTWTATAGSVTSTVTLVIATPTQEAGRTVAITGSTSATANGDGVPMTVTVKDRYGNAVSGVSLTLSATGVAAFAGGATTQAFTTDSTGTYTFQAKSYVAAGGVGTYKVSASNATDAASIAGYVGATAVDSTLAAGVSSATATVTFAAGDDLAAANAQAATDAAAEATDAANAATDAANAAAEAADAATAAAQDAADAVAALSTQVTEMVSALKKQITALTNLVIKIQKKVKA